MRDNPNGSSSGQASFERTSIEPVLRQHLGRVAAPAELKYSLKFSANLKSSQSGRLAWAAAAALFLIGGALGGHTYVRHAVATRAVWQPAASVPLRHNSVQGGTKFAMQLACQACHTSSQL